MRKSPYRRTRGTYPRPGVVFGEAGLEDVLYTGQLPFAAIGACTHNRYKWSTMKPVRSVDKRDLPSIVIAGGGVDNFSMASANAEAEEE